MAWKTTTFRREALYEEVWTEPIVRVASRYGISDVGLRKICLSLDIPIPPRGYWAKIAAGQKVKRPALGKSAGNPNYTRSVHIEDKDPQLEQRILETREAAALPVLGKLSYVASDDLSKLGREATQLAKATRTLKEHNGTISLMDRAWADIDVSMASRNRALQLLDQFATAFKALGGTFDLTPEPADVEVPPPYQRKRTDIRRGHLSIHGKKFFIRVKERVKSEEITEPVEQKPKTRGRSLANEPDFSGMYASRKYHHTATGQLQFFVHRMSTYFDESKTEDTRLTKIEDKLYALVERLEASALKQKLSDDIAREKALERERQSELWQRRKVVKDTLLKKLERFETKARNLDRAESLRRLAKKISAASAPPPDLVESLGLLETMANWLDPLVALHWPEVDGTPDKNPYSSW